MTRFGDRKVGGGLLVTIASLFGVLLLIVGGSLWWTIHVQINKSCAIAQEAYPHPFNDGAALIAFVNAEDQSLAGRNLAVWTLGRLKDPRALAALESHYTGQPCDHRISLCQYELKKAIKRCGGAPAPHREK